jgi:hypothetical protein
MANHNEPTADAGSSALYLACKGGRVGEVRHSSRASTFLPVHTVKCAQTLKADATISAMGKTPQQLARSKKWDVFAQWFDNCIVRAAALGVVDPALPAPPRALVF